GLSSWRTSVSGRKNMGGAPAIVTWESFLLSDGTPSSAAGCGPNSYGKTADLLRRMRGARRSQKYSLWHPLKGPPTAALRSGLTQYPCKTAQVLRAKAIASCAKNLQRLRRIVLVTWLAA